MQKLQGIELHEILKINAAKTAPNLHNYLSHFYVPTLKILILKIYFCFLKL